MALRLKANRRFPSIPVVTDDPKNHTQVLMAIKEAMEIGQRRTTDLLNSYIRVQDLVDLGLIDFEGNTTAIIGADLSQIASIGDLTGVAEGDFLRFEGGQWVNDQLALTDITQAMVTQHQAALSIAYGQVTGVPSIPNDISSATFITADDETATLANSLKLMAGSNVTFDTSTPGELKISASGGGGGSVTGALVTRAAAQSVSTGTDTAVEFSTEVHDGEGYWDVGNPTRFTIPSTGWYVLAGRVNISASGTGRRILGSRVNGSNLISDYSHMPVNTSNTGTRMNTSTVYRLTEGDYVELVVRQDSGAARDLESPDGGTTPAASMSIARIG